MRIWTFPSFYPYDYPGMRWHGIFAHRQYKGLVAAGAQVTVVVPVLARPNFPFSLTDKHWKHTSHAHLPRKRVHDGITVYHPRIPNMRPARFWPPYKERYLQTILKFFKEHKLHKDDILFSQWLPEGIIMQEAARILGVRSAILTIGDDVVLWPKASAEHFKVFEKALTQANFYFTCADYLGREANKMLGKNLHYNVVYMGVDYHRFKPVTEPERTALREKYKVPADKIAILCVGTAIVRKGWLDLFDALQMVKKTSDNFVIIGVYAGDAELDLVKEAAARGLSENFINVGEVAPANTHELFSAADMVCLASHWEGLANVVIEGMSSGLPVVTTNVCGHPELVTDGVNGILVEPKQPAQLAQKLQLLLSDKNERERLGANARKHIVEHWGDFNDNSKKLFDILSRGTNE